MEKKVKYTYNRIVLSHKKEWKFAICNNMDDLERIMLKDISQTKKDKYFMLSFVREL